MYNVMSNRSSMIAYAVCSVLWTLLCIWDVVGGRYQTDSIGFMLDVICAAAWVIGFVIYLKKVRSDKDE